ncbi:hypothetical protein HAX54_002367 [Datura stramonium]|uniref:Uncharacterized protein n=1 Tax=Datura stramonium TaxID=4076 RepID=A0ABS8T4H0_DATST|nr:hypothetical protein [Datura stramonium]
MQPRSGVWAHFDKVCVYTFVEEETPKFNQVLEIVSVAFNVDDPRVSFNAHCQNLVFFGSWSVSIAAVFVT